MHMLADDAVWGAEGAHAHLLGQRSPPQHHRVHADGVLGVGPVEAKRFDVVKHQVTLRRLVELELDHLRPVLGGPVLQDFLHRFDRHAACEMLRHEVLVRGCANHKFHFRVDFGLGWGAERDGKAGRCWGGFGFGRGIFERDEAARKDSVEVCSHARLGFFSEFGLI